MRSILVPYDGSKEAETMLRRLAQEAQRGDAVLLDVLNVQPSLGGYVSQFVGSRVVRDFQLDCGRQALAGAERILKMAGVSYHTHVRAGDAASVILRAAADLGVDQIVMPGSSDGIVGKFLQLVLIARIVRRAAVPVLIVAAEPPSFGLNVTLDRPRSSLLG
jgi:nucleotide-binding universal stress UspA family protein